MIHLSGNFNNFWSFPYQGAGIHLQLAWPAQEANACAGGGGNAPEYSILPGAEADAEDVIG